MSFGAVYWNNLTDLALTIKQNTGFLTVKVNGTALGSAPVQYLVEIVQRINLGQYGGELLAHTGGLLLLFVSKNVGNLSVGHSGVRMHHCFVKLIAANLPFRANLHFTDHA